MNKTKAVTHSGKFHTDDVFAFAALSLLFPDIEIVRTRDEDIIDKADLVFDVGRVYDPSKKRFDHHQPGGGGKRENGIPYSSVGLIWKDYGEMLCKSVVVAERIDKKLIQPIDAGDNGIAIATNIFPGIIEYAVHDMVGSFNLSWKEGDDLGDEMFRRVSEIAKEILIREIKKETDKFESENIIEKIYNETVDKRIIVLDNRYQWKDVLMKHPEPLAAIFPYAPGKWGIKAVETSPASFKYRLTFPASWAGKASEELVKITGVKDAEFCHNGRYFAVANSKEGALELTKLAIES